jgi:3-deoxy-D-manno-octulosonate 8-phosphate phosphatase (KDO 8-P phosphatase)
MTSTLFEATRLLLLDVDGILTDGRIVYTDAGEEVKTFNVKDGLGLRLLMQAGTKVALATGRQSSALRHRCLNLGIDNLFQSVKDKVAILPMLQQKINVTPEQITFAGDDLPDLALKKRVGCFVTVADAAAEVKQQADWVSRCPGGHGAVREICEAILKAQGHWETIVARFIEGENAAR